MTREQLWTQLASANLVSGEVPASAATGQQSPWPVRLMLGFAGWLGALFLLGFAFMTFSELSRSWVAAFTAGVGGCLAAFAMYRASIRNDFMSQFAFAISLAGQALILTGLMRQGGEHALTFFLMAAIQAVLALVIPDYLHRVFTTVAANLCLMLASEMAGALPLATAVTATGAAIIWLYRDQLQPIWEPIGYGFAIALLYVDGSAVFGSDLMRLIFNTNQPMQWWIVRAATVLSGIVFVYVVWILRERAGAAITTPAGTLVSAASLVIAFCGLAAPGLSGAIVVIVLGFANSRRVLVGLGVLAFGAYLVHFYYQLSLSLLTKSMVMLATGAALLLLNWAIGRYLPGQPGPGDAVHA